MADRSVVVRLQADVAQYQAGMSGASAATTELETAARAASGAVSTVGLASLQTTTAIRQLSNSALLFGGLILGGFLVSAKAARDFQTAMAGVATTVHGTPQQIDAIGSGLRKLADNIPVSREGLAAIAEQAGKVGIQAPNIVKFTEVAAKLAADTNLSGTDAAAALGRLVVAAGTVPSAYSNVASAVVDLGNKTNAGEDRITFSALQIAGAGHAIGLTAPELLGWGAAIASLGPAAQGAALGVTSLFTKIAASVTGGNAYLATFAKVAGESTAQFAHEFDTNANGALLKVIDGMHRLSAEGGPELLGFLNSVGLGGSRGARVIAALADNSQVLHDKLDISNAAFEKNNALNTEAAIRFATASSEMTLFHNRVSDVGITLGNDFLPVMVDAAKVAGELAAGVGKIASSFSDLPAPIRDGVVAMGLMGAGGLVLIGTLGRLTVTAISAARALGALHAVEAGGAAADLGTAGAEIGAGTIAAAGAPTVAAGGVIRGGTALAPPAAEAAATSSFTRGASSVLGIAAPSTVTGLAGAVGGLGLAGAAGVGALGAVGLGGPYIAGLELSKKATKENVDAVNKWSSAIEAVGAVGVPGVGQMAKAFQFAFDSGSKGAKDTKSALDPLAKTTQSVSEAQKTLDDTVAKYGPHSTAAHTAAVALNTALAGQSKLQRDVQTAMAGATASTQHSIPLTDQLAGGIAKLSATSGLSVTQIAKMGAAGDLSKTQLRTLGLSAAEAEQFFSTGAGAALGLGNSITGMGASASASAIQLDALVQELENLQALQFATQGAALSFQGAIDSVIQAGESSGGGGGGGSKKTQAQDLQNQRQVPDAYRAVDDAARKLQDSQRALADAQTAVADSAQATVSAEHQLADAQYSQHQATLDLGTAERQLQETLHGVAVNSALAAGALRKMTDTHLDAEEATITLGNAQDKLATATTAVHDALVLHGADSTVYKQAVRDQEQAQIDLTRAQESASDTRTAAQQSEKAYQDLLKGSPANSTRAQQAEKNLQAARSASNQANDALISAEEGLQAARVTQVRDVQDEQRSEQDLRRSQQDLIRSYQDLNATIYDVAHGLGLAGGAAGGFKDKQLQLNQALLAGERAAAAFATQNAINSGYLKGSYQYTRAYYDELVKEDQYARATLGPNNPLTKWLDSQVTQYHNLLTLGGQYQQLLQRLTPPPQELKTPGGRAITTVPGQLAADGGYFPYRPGGYQRTVGEAGDELVLPLNNPGRMEQLLASVMPFSAAGGDSSLAREVAALGHAIRTIKPGHQFTANGLDAREATRGVMAELDRRSALA